AGRTKTGPMGSFSPTAPPWPATAICAVVLSSIWCRRCCTLWGCRSGGTWTASRGRIFFSRRSPKRIRSRTFPPTVGARGRPMPRPFLASIVVLAVVALPAAKDWTPSRTPWGDPDLQGTYDNNNEYATPLERPAEFEGRRASDLTPAEIAELRRRAT